MGYGAFWAHVYIAARRSRYAPWVQGLYICLSSKLRLDTHHMSCSVLFKIDIILGRSIKRLATRIRYLDE